LRALPPERGGARKAAGAAIIEPGTGGVEERSSPLVSALTEKQVLAQSGESRRAIDFRIEGKGHAPFSEFLP
jgi:hypothetical protein